MIILDSLNNKKILQSTAIRLKYYGQVGGVSPDTADLEWYRAPEFLLGEVDNKLNGRHLTLAKAGWEITETVDCFAIGCLIVEMLEDGQPLFCKITDGPHYFLQRLAILYHSLGPIKEYIGSRIEEKFPGTFTEEDYSEVTWRGDHWSDDTLTFLESNVSLQVGPPLNHNTLLNITQTEHVQ